MGLAEFELDDKTTILMEVPEDLDSGGGFERASKGGDLAVKAKKSFAEAMDQVKPVAETVLATWRRLNEPADEVEVKFNLKLSADAGAIITSVGGEASFEITLKWKSDSKAS